MGSTVVKGLKMLEALVTAEKPCALTDMARVCGMTKSNAHRLLRTLEECRYVRQDPQTKTYEPTLRLWELGTRVFRRTDLRGAAAPHLKSLAQATEESVHLSIFEGDEVVYVDKVDSVHAVRAYIGVGDRAPVYCTATGKAILAFQPKETVDRICRHLKRFTPNTDADPKHLKQELIRIRARGYAITLGEWQPGVLGIAAPLMTAAGTVVAGVGIAGPAERMRQADQAQQVALVLAAAQAISRELGFSDQPVEEEVEEEPRPIAKKRVVGSGRQTR